MARAVRVAGRVLWVLLPLLAVGLFLALPQRVVRASYSDPYWDQDSTSPECICETCGCEGPSEFSPEGVSWRTGALRFAIPLFDTPSREGRNVYSLIWRSDISGASQFGNGIVPSFLRTLEITQDGAVVYDRLPSGLIITWERSGTYPDYTWSTSDCNVSDTLTKNGGGFFEVRTLWDDVWLFSASGMPDLFTSRNGVQ